MLTGSQGRLVGADQHGGDSATVHQALGGEHHTDPHQAHGTGTWATLFPAVDEETAEDESPRRPRSHSSSAAGPGSEPMSAHPLPQDTPGSLCGQRGKPKSRLVSSPKERAVKAPGIRPPPALGDSEDPYGPD